VSWRCRRGRFDGFALNGGGGHDDGVVHNGEVVDDGGDGEATP
jgi:hypothetical protein